MAIDKRPRVIGGMFDDITPTYDRLNHVLSLSIDRIWRREGLDKLDIKEGDLVLDIATGTGDMALQASHRAKCSIVGLDLSTNMMLTAARKWKEQRAQGDYSLVKGDALTMPFPDGTFDKAMVAYGIRNMVDIERFGAEVFRVLRPGGRFEILELSVPAGRIARPTYLVYLTKILPAIGGIQSGKPDAYRYLSDSITSFPVPKKVEQLMEAQGFKVVESIAQTRGICHLYLLEKPR